MFCWRALVAGRFGDRQCPPTGRVCQILAGCEEVARSRISQTAWYAESRPQQDLGGARSAVVPCLRLASPDPPTHITKIPKVLKSMKKTMNKFITVFLLSGASAFAGSFTSDFSNAGQTGFNLVGASNGVANAWMPVITGGVLVLTTNYNSLQGAININDLDSGQQIESFTAQFKLQFGPGTDPPADGLSFIFGPDVAAGSSLVVEFDTYDNGGGEAPAVDVILFGTEIAHTPFTIPAMLTANLENVLITLKRNGTLSVSYKNQVVYTNLWLPGWGPTSGQFGLNARTGGLNQVCDLDDLSLTTVTAPASPVAPSVTTPPASVTVAEGASATFTVGFDGSSPLNFQWTTNGTAIPDATNNILVLNRVHFSDNGALVRCVVSNTTPPTATSAPATLNVTRDTTAPTLVSADGSEDFTHVTVVFSEPVSQSTAQNTANYTISSLSVSSATQVAAPNDNKVVLTTSQQTSGATYTLTVNNVQDQATTANTIAPNSQISVVAWVIANGICKAEYWNNIGGVNVAALTADARYIAGTPDLLHYHVGLDASESYINGDVNNYGAKVTGWIIPPTTGNWNFFIRSDDASQLFLSTDATPGNLSATPICQESGCCNPFQEPPAPTATASPISLVGGNRYYFQALLKEGGGGDYVQVAMRQDTDTTPAGNLKPISGSRLAAAVSPVGASLTINQQPQSVTGVDGKAVSFTIGASGSSSALGNTVLYQWRRGGASGTDISGATGTRYSIPVVSLATDNNAQFVCVVAVPGITRTSTVATLTVVADTFPPVPLVGTITRNDGTIEVGVGFDEAVNPADLVPANFSLIGGTSSTLSFPTNSYGDYTGVLFDTAGLVPGTTYQVNVKNVRDLKGNALPASGTNVNFTVGKFAWANTGTQIRPGQVVPVGTDGFDILNGGRQEWSTYDETTFAYVKKTNNFDVKLQVVYAEPGSQWTRVGLIARNGLDIGETPDDRNNTSNSTASAYAQTHVNPNQTLGSSGRFDPTDPVQPANNTPNNGHEQNCRLATGSTTSGWGNPSVSPSYPFVWLRLKRSSGTLQGFRSDDGESWTDQGTVTLVTQQPDMYVGPFLAVETGNIWPGGAGGFDVWGAPLNPTYDRLFVAQFRNFGDVPSAVAPAPIAIRRAGASIVLSWGVAGTLQQSPVLGPSASWLPTPGAPNTPTGGSYTNTPGGAALFYRLLQL